MGQSKFMNKSMKGKRRKRSTTSPKLKNHKFPVQYGILSLTEKTHPLLASKIFHKIVGFFVLSNTFKQGKMSLI